MARHTLAVALALCALAVTAPAALAHEGNPNYDSSVTALEPGAPGLSAQVLNYDDRLELRNEGDEPVTIEGYDGEPYARILPDGTVEVNELSPATYLNEDRFAAVEVPARADESAPPEWRVVDRSGRFEWHDHRMHWMGDDLPRQVTDEEARTKVFDWDVPLTIGSTPGAIRGDLFWDPVPGGGFPLPAAIALAGVALAGGALVVVVRRRRRRPHAEPAEAW